MELILAIALCILILILVLCLLNMARDSRYRDEYTKMISTKMSERPDEYSYRYKYTDEFLKYLDSIISATCNIMFKEFFSQIKNADKITKIKIQQLVENTAKKVLAALNMENINTEILLVTQEYWTWYIAHLIMVTINDKFEKSLIDIIDEGGTYDGREHSNTGSGYFR